MITPEQFVKLVAGNKLYQSVVGGNILEDTDSYKLRHFPMYPEGTTKVYSYFECRSGAKFPFVKMFGTKLLVQELLRPITQAELEEAYTLSVEHGLPLNKEGWQHIIDKHHGYLPLRIKAVAEGTVLPVSNALMTVENTDDKCAWLTNYVETFLSRIWYPITVASYSYAAKQILKSYLVETSDDLSILDFQLHDFGSRGTTNRFQAMIGAAAHLTNFLGTDTVIALRFLKDFYGADKCPGFSVHATEHSIMTSLGEAGEFELLQGLVAAHPTGILSLVIDSYNDQRFVSEYAKRLRDKILARDGKVVFRPDSGDPVTVSLDIYNRLAEVFGETTNSKGFRVLNPKVGLLWGDGIDVDGIKKVLDAFKENKISSCNIVFGMGGGLLQKLTRDTMRCAFKCSAQMRNGEMIPIQKNPRDSSKKSKSGVLGVINTPEGIITVEQSDPRYVPSEDLLKTVYENGCMIGCNATLADLRKEW